MQLRIRRITLIATYRVWDMFLSIKLWPDPTRMQSQLIVTFLCQYFCMVGGNKCEQSVQKRKCYPELINRANQKEEMAGFVSRQSH